MSLPRIAHTQDTPHNPFEPAQEEKLQQLRQWCNSNGVRFHSVQILSRNHQRGLYATSDIGSGDIIISIPRRVAIIADVSNGNPPDLHVFRGIAPSFWKTASWETRLVITLLDECALGSASLFHPYLDILPSNPWSALWAYQVAGRQKLVEQLKSYRMHHVADSYRAHVKSIFVAFQNALPSALRAQVSLLQFSWAMCICQSRAFGVPPGTTPDNSTMDHPTSSNLHPSVRLERKKVITPVRYALFPGLDMANHSVHCQTSFRYDPGADEYIVVTRTNFTAGQEVYLSYGPKSNDDLMFFYSFVEGDNPANTVKISDFHEWILDLASSRHDTDRRRQNLLRPLLKSKLSTNDLYEFHQSGISDNIMNLLRLALTKGEDLPKLVRELETNPDRLTRPLNLENELSCWFAIDEKCQQLLNELGEFTEEEQQRLTDMYSTRPCSAVWKWCEQGSDGELMYRYERQTALSTISERVRHFSHISSAVGRVCTVLMPPTQSLLKTDAFNDIGGNETSGVHKFLISPEDLNLT